MDTELTRREILLFADPKDLVSLCNVDRVNQEICQDERFWEQYFLEHNRPPPTRPSQINVGQYYLDEYLYLNEAEKWVTFLDYYAYFRPDVFDLGLRVDFSSDYIMSTDPTQEDRYVPHYPEVGDDLVSELGLRDEDEHIFKDFLELSRYYLEHPDEFPEDGLQLDIVPRNNAYLVISYEHPEFSISMNRNQIKLLISRLISYGLPFIDIEPGDVLELPV